MRKNTVEILKFGTIKEENGVLIIDGFDFKNTISQVSNKEAAVIAIINILYEKLAEYGDTKDYRKLISSEIKYKSKCIS